MQKTYSSQDIQVLEGLVAVRKRPGMYIGSLDKNGLHHLFWEILDNAIDEALAGYCNHITTLITNEEAIIIEDNGRGIPVDIHATTGKTGLETVFTLLHAGGKFNNDVYKTSGGLHGVGASVVNALSSFLEVTSYRDGKQYCLNFQNGGQVVSDLVVTPLLANPTKTGTKVVFKADQTIFSEINMDYEVIKERLKELAFLNNNVIISIEDQRVNKKETFLFKRGIIEYIEQLNNNKNPIHDEVIYFKELIGKTEVECAWQYSASTTGNILSFCNNIYTQEGGSHEDGTKQAMVRSMTKLFKHQKILSKELEKENFIFEDLKEGLMLIIAIKHSNPIYQGQTKHKLGNPEVKSELYQLVGEFYDRFLLENPDVTKKIIAKVAIAFRVRMEAKKAREITRKKNSIDSFSLPGKLADCSSANPALSEIYIVEGESAGGSAKLGRNRTFQAILALKGKVINVEKTTIEKIFDNEEIKSLFASIGCSIAKPEDIINYKHDLRYHKIIIMTDADVDGSHIRVLLLTFFYKYMRFLIEHGHIYIAQPPLYKLERGKTIKYLYNDHELEKLKPSLVNVKYNLQRYKGLGEMNPIQLWDTTMNPEFRQLLKVTINEAELADKMFLVLMGKNVQERKKFIETNAKFVKNLDI